MGEGTGLTNELFFAENTHKQQINFSKVNRQSPRHPKCQEYNNESDSNNIVVSRKLFRLSHKKAGV